MDDQDKIKKILGLKTSCIDSRTDMISKFENYWDLYNSYIERQDIPWKSQLFLKETFRAIDTIKPYFMQTLFTSADPFDIVVLDPEKTDLGRKIQKLISYYIEKSEMYLPMEDFILEMLIYGTSFAKLIWDKQVCTREVEEVMERNKVVAEMFNEDVELLEEQSPEVIVKTVIDVVKNSPALYNINYTDIFFSPTARNLEDSWVIHRTYRTLSSLKEENERVKKATGKEKYKNLGKLEEDLMFHNAMADRYKDSEKQGIQTQFDSMGINSPSHADVLTPLKNDDGELEMLEFWNREATEVTTVAAGLRIIKEGKNPYVSGKKPFIYANYIRRPGKIWGIGVAELAQGGQDLLNTAVNQAIDSNNLANNLMVAVSSEANFDPEQAKARPGGFLVLDTDDKPIQSVFQQIPFNKVNTDSEIALAKDEIQSTTGANAFMQGTYQSGAVRNNGQQQMLMSAGGNKFQGKILTFEHMFLKPFVRKFYSLIGQYLNKETVISIVGRNGVEYEKIRPEDLVKDLDFIPKGARQIAELSQSLHEINNFIAIAGQIPQAEAIVNFRYLITKMWSKLSSDHDVDQVILPDVQSELNLEQMMQMQGGQQGRMPMPTQGGTAEQGNPGGGRQV